MMKLSHLLSGFLLLAGCQGSCQSPGNELTVHLTFSEEMGLTAGTQGRLFLFFSQNPHVEPRNQIWPNPWAQTHIFAQNLRDLNPREEKVIPPSAAWDRTAEWTLENIPAGEYYLQVLWDQDTVESRINAPGNRYSEKQNIRMDGPSEISFTIDQVIQPREVADHELVRIVDLQSDTLSKWWNRPVFLKASVLLPPGYSENEGRPYPIRYNIAGFGGRYTRVNRLTGNEEFMNWWTSGDAPRIINVFLDGEGPFGDPYQMDSENSGPYGHALIHELIPHIESRFRGTGDPETRFLDGCSTGGWVSLGLQLFYPDHFNGAFSYSPDAVEFENYQLINIYRDDNAFYNEFGYLRPVMRDVSGEPLMSLRDFIQVENVLSPSGNYLQSSGQIGAHTALYSPRGDDGLPAPLFDPFTGRMDPEVAEHWKKYDFKIFAREHWETLGPKLAGKIHIWMGDMDHFYLNMATRSFADFLEGTENPKSDAEIVFAPYEGHCTQYSHRTVLEKIGERIRQLNNEDGK